MPDAIRLVLDTNVVIDWLVFDDPYMNPLRERVGSDVVVVTHAFAMSEFERVLCYPALRLVEPRRAAALTQYRACSQVASMPLGFALNEWRLPDGFPNCRDRDDDLFLALAYHSAASALVTRDKALLKMRKRVRKFGVAVWDVQHMITQLAAMRAVSAP